jgi:hypothetical protein
MGKISALKWMACDYTKQARLFPWEFIRETESVLRKNGSQLFLFLLRNFWKEKKILTYITNLPWASRLVRCTLPTSVAWPGHRSDHRDARDRVPRIEGRYSLFADIRVRGLWNYISDLRQRPLGIGPTTFLWPIIIIGFALSFVFVPITTQSYDTLRNEQIGNASGIFNLVRNVGGSVGISLAQTLLTRRSDYHQNEITNDVARSQIWFQQQTNSLNAFLGQVRNPVNALQSSQSTMYRELGQQELLWAFVDVFPVDCASLLLLRCPCLALSQGQAHEGSGSLSTFRDTSY